MAKCQRCGKFVLISTSSGFCKGCDEQVRKEKEEQAIAEQKRLEEQRRIEQQVRAGQRQREAEQRKAEQKRLLQSSFELRNGIRFGDDIDEVKAKETNRFDEKYTTKGNRIAYRGTFTGASEFGETIYTFNDTGLLVNMEYSYIRDNYGNFNSPYSPIREKLTAALKQKYGEPVYIRSAFDVYKKKHSSGEEYTLVINNACKYDEISRLSTSPSLSYLYGWVIRDGDNDVIIHLWDGSIGISIHGKDFVEVGYTIVRHYNVLQYIEQDKARMIKELQDKEEAKQALINEL